MHQLLECCALRRSDSGLPPREKPRGQHCWHRSSFGVLETHPRGYCRQTRPAQVCFGQVECTAIHAPAVYEVFVGHDADCTRIVCVSVVEIAAAVEIVVVDARVIDVDIARIAVAVVIPRAVRFAESEREPANAAAESETKSDPPAATTIESDKGRTPIGTRVIRTWAPAPTAADVVPTSIVERSITPGRVVNPSPAPRTDVTPIAVTVGRPTDVNDGGIPNVAIFGNFVPSAVVIEIAVANGFARNIFCGNGIVFFQVAAL